MGHVLIFLFLDYYWIECKIINGKKKGLLKNILALGFLYCCCLVSSYAPAYWLDLMLHQIWYSWDDELPSWSFEKYCISVLIFLLVCTSPTFFSTMREGLTASHGVEGEWFIVNIKKMVELFVFLQREVLW